MAIPTLLRQTDYAGVDFTDKAQGTFEVLKDALVDKFGWTLLFEDLSSPDKSFVVANTGSQSCLKITKEDGDSYYLKFEAAQSYSDINTPVNTIQSCYYYIRRIDGFFYIVGDSKRFYFVIYESELITESSNSISMFMGDVIPFTENNPDVFVFFPSRISSPKIDTGKSASYAGVLGGNSILNDLDNGSAGGTINLFKYDGLEMSILSAGNSYTPLIHNISTANPCVLSEAYLVNQARDENNMLKLIGKFPGIAYSLTPSDKVTSKNRGELVTIAGQQCITFPHQRYEYYNKGVILLNDWDVL